MTIDDRNIIWLDLFPFLTYQKKSRILDLFPRGVDIKKSFSSKFEIRNMLTDLEYNKMLALVDDKILDDKIARYQADGIEMITIHDSKYPHLLREISSPPLCLYCKGNTQLLDTNCIAIVGTRKPTDYGIVVTKQYAKAFAECDLTIVSGLATGVDTIAHKTALENDGKTIAVLAGGLYNIYPATNISLAKKLTENNLIISENCPTTPSLSYLFPIRNRIIAGLSRGVVVTEGAEKSGSLKTARFGLEYNREVFAVPGKINSPMSKGTNSLIKNLTASITLSPDDVLDALNIEKENSKNISRQLDIKEQFVLNYIRTEKRTFQEIADYTEMSAHELNTILMGLEMEGLVTKLANNSYIMS